MNRKWVFVGCGGLLALALLLGGCSAIVAVLGAGGGGTAPEEEASAPAAPGEPVEVGETVWVVDGAERTQSLRSQFGEFGEDRQGEFVVVDFTFTNNGPEAATLDTVSTVLVDSEGRRFEADPDAFEYIEESRNVFLEQVNPGVSREGTAIFTVAPDAEGFTLELGDADMFTDETGAVDLGF